MARPNQLRLFLESCNHNWRNTIFIECSEHCPAGKEERCSFLYVPAMNGRPVLLPISNVEFIFNEQVDPSACLGKMCSPFFLKLYDKWLDSFPHASMPNSQQHRERSPGHHENCPLMHAVFQ